MKETALFYLSAGLLLHSLYTLHVLYFPFQVLALKEIGVKFPETVIELEPEVLRIPSAQDFLGKLIRRHGNDIAHTGPEDIAAT